MRAGLLPQNQQQTTTPEMQDQLPPNKTGNERGMLDPSSTGYDREMGNQNRIGTMQTMRSAGMGIGMGMREGAQTVERREKMRIYREKHREAKETFARIGGMPVETEADAVEVMARKLKGGTYREVAQLIFASAHFCWACDEKNAEKELEELER